MAGFTASQDQANGEYCGKLFNYSVDATHSTLLAPGDVVVLTGTANAFGIGGVDAAAAGAQVSGVIAGVRPQYEGEQLSETGLPALTAGEVQCHIDPMLNFDVNVENGPLAVTSVGLNADIVANAATKLGGLTVSNMTLNATGVATTQTLQFRIVRLLEDEDGVLGNRAQVRFNNTTISDGAAGV